MNSTMKKKETLTSQPLADKGAGAKRAPSMRQALVWPNTIQKNEFIKPAAFISM
jgi:hypothetical protein